MPKKITTLNMLNAKLEEDFAATTLAAHNNAEAEAAIITSIKLCYINELRSALGEPIFVMYCEEVDGETRVFQDIKRQQALPK